MKLIYMMKTAYLSSFLIILLVVTSIFSIQPSGVYSALEGPLSITIDSPSPDAEVNAVNVDISGTYVADNIAKTDLLFTVSENGNVISDSSINQSDWNIDDTSTTRTWSFTDSSFLEGRHDITVEIKNTITNDIYTATVSFIITNSIAVTALSINILSPQSNDAFNSKHVEISGEYRADGVSKKDLKFVVLDENGNIVSDSTTNQSDWNIDDSSSPKKWAFTATSLEEGEHNFTVQIKNLLTNETAVNSTDFRLFFTRPIIMETGIVLANGTERKGEDLTNVPLDAKLKITIADDQQMDQLKTKIQTNYYNPIKVLLGSDTLQGTTEISSPVAKNGKYYYDIIFTPNSNELKINKTYLVYIDPQLMDDLDNPIFTKLFKFTTMTNVKWDDPDDPQSHASSNPHGHYQLNTNMCAACHSTHESKGPTLTDGTYQIDFNEQLTKDQPVNDPSQNYCMACHDGTVNAPSIENKESQHLHGYTAANTEVMKQQESCTSCHNPHLEWSEENQNLLKDHYVYTHNEAHPDQGLETPTVDSLDTSCDSCHDVIDFSTISSDKGKLETLAYNKSLTAKGTITNKLTNPSLKTISDYSLCLRCHNAEKSVQDSKPSDIETLYLKQTSGHNFVLSADQQTQRDGSVLSGAIPCAECHETHVSNNLFNLREILGNNVVANSDKYKTVGTTWNEPNERNFCLNCHNKGTEIYGKQAKIDTTISGHQAADSRGCSECHSDQTKTYKDFRDQSINAAHAPLAGVDLSTP
ncbi:hypothetical protein V7266_03630 [Neobacillus drentensis]|uniref:hypothetical protein n=1 Tax=Neobacillus drentensis TaxID=220684 RepID=UPI002FFEDBE7